MLIPARSNKAKPVAVLLLLVTLVWALLVAGCNDREGANDNRVSGVVLVGLRDGLSVEQAGEVFSRNGYNPSDWEELSKGSSVYRVQFSEEETGIDQVIEDLEKDQDVKYAEPDYIRRAF